MTEDFSTLDARKSICAKYAAKYGIPTALLCAVAEQESGWNCWAIRYEPAFYDRYIQPLVNTGAVKSMTEATARATSYGLCQVMGQVAREQGFAGRYLTELCDPDCGLEMGAKKLAACLKAKPDTFEALQKYNGGGNPSYGHEVLARVAKYE